MTATPSPWPRPSEAVRELLRKGAEIAQGLPQDWIDHLNQSLISSPEEAALLEDPVLLAACWRANRAETLHWANANIQRPGEPVAAYVSADMIDTARELARRGQSDLLMNIARTSQNAAWEIWLKTAFRLTQDPVLLEELLAVLSRSITDFIGSNMRLLSEVALEEKNAMLLESHMDKRSLVSRLLDCGEADAGVLSRRLGYSMAQKHYACLIWSEEPDAEIGPLEEAARALASLTGNAAPLIVLAGAATVWSWSGAVKPLEPLRLQEIMRQFPTVRAAVSSMCAGLNGFRRAHLEALTTQRLMGRLAGSPAIASTDQARMVSLMTQDVRASKQFVSSTLGRLATESPVLQRSLHAFLANGCNITQTAEVLGTHRNTLLRRLERAQDLLPAPLENHRIQIAAALELLVWSTPPAGSE